MAIIKKAVGGLWSDFKSGGLSGLSIGVGEAVLGAPVGTVVGGMLGGFVDPRNAGECRRYAWREAMRALLAGGVA